MTVIPGRPRAQTAADVLVIGTGLSGLNAALTLEELGLSVAVVEAWDRVGGRVYTLSDKPEMPETGGSEIGPMYARTLSAVERFGLSLEPWQISRLEFMLHVGGQSMTVDQWKTSDANPLKGPLRAMPRLCRGNPVGAHSTDCLRYKVQGSRTA